MPILAPVPFWLLLLSFDLLVKVKEKGGELDWFHGYCDGVLVKVDFNRYSQFGYNDWKFCFLLLQRLNFRNQPESCSAKH